MYAVAIGYSRFWFRGRISLLHCLLYFDLRHLTHNLHLLRNMPERSNDLLISMDKTKLSVRQALLLRELLYEFARPS